MPSSATHSTALHPWSPSPADASALARLEERLPPLLSVIAGMVDLTGFFTLGNIFTAHITGNLVVVAALIVRGGSPNLAQVLAIPVFMLALAVVWLIARGSGQHGPGLARLLLLIQFILLAGVLTVSVITRPAASPHGVTADIIAMAAVSAMACQYAVFRLAIPGAISTAVMTGNLTNAVLSLMDRLSPDRPLMTVDRERLKRSLMLLLSFFAGCCIAAAAIAMLGEWAWSFPAALAGLALALR